MTGHELQLGLLSLAFWIAVVQYARGSRRRSPRLVLGLCLGALLSCIGWWVLHRSTTPIGLGQGLLSGGATLLLFPLGPLLFCREAAAFRSLPLALAVARTGCLAAGCCHGLANTPTRELEIAGFVAMHVLLRKLDDRHVIPAFLVSFAVMRLASEPWRASSLRADLLVPVSWIAMAWIATGAAAWLHTFVRPDPGVAVAEPAAR